MPREGFLFNLSFVCQHSDQPVENQLALLPVIDR